MRFLALSPAASYTLLAGVALVILLLHLLRPPPPRVLIASVLLWARVGRARKRPAARRLLTLLLALGAGVSMALALTQPEIPAIGASARRLVLILDNSPSMTARTHDGRSRWQHAVEQASALLRQSGAATEVMVMDAAGQLRMSGFVERDAALAMLPRIPVGGWESAARLPPAPAGPGVEVHLFTDGVAQIEAAQRAIVHSTFEAADNVAVTAFAARPLTQDPTRYEALVQVLNASPSAQRVRLLITGENAFVRSRDLELRAGETANAIFDISDYAGGVLAAAAVAKQDAFALDDVAYTVIPPHRPKRVLLVTAGNPPLEDALRSLPGVRLSVGTRERYPHLGEHDAVVFDRFAPSQAPTTGALLFLPPARNWLAGRSALLAGPQITDSRDGRAVADGIAWPNLRLIPAPVEASAHASARPAPASSAASRALITAGEARARWIKVGFALQDSNFPLLPDFPVFLGNALRWVSDPVPVLTSGLGSVEVELPGARVTDGGGTPVPAAATAHGVVFEASRADVFTVSVPGRQIVVVAGLPDPHFALINRTHLNGPADPAPAGRTTARSWDLEPWMMLLLLAIAFLLAEWAVFSRRLSA